MIIMKSEFKCFLLILVFASVASLPTYNGELLTDEYIPSQQPHQYPYIWNGRNVPPQPGSFPMNVQNQPRSFPENGQIQPQYEIRSPAHQTAYGSVPFQNYYQTGMPAEQKFNPRQHNLGFHSKFGPISAQQYDVFANTARDIALQQQLENQQADLGPENVVFHPTYGPISPLQQYQPTEVPPNTAKDMPFQHQISAMPHYKQIDIPDKTAKDMALEQQLPSQQAEKISPNLANYVMRHPTAIHRSPSFSQQQFVQNPLRIPAFNQIPTSHSNFPQYRQFDEPIEIAHPSNVVKTIPLVSAAPQPNWKQDIRNIRANDMEHSASNNIQNRLSNIHRDVHAETSKNSKNHKASNSIQNRITNENKQIMKNATNANAIKNLYTYLNRQFEKNSSWPSLHNINQLISDNPEIVNALVPSMKTGEKKYIVIHADGTVEHVEELETVAQKFPNYVLVKPNHHTDATINEPDIPPMVNLPEIKIKTVGNLNQQIPDLSNKDAEETQVQMSSPKTEVSSQQQPTYPRYEVPPSLSTTTSNKESSNISSVHDTQSSITTITDAEPFSEANFLAVPVLDQNIIDKNNLMETIISGNYDEKDKVFKSDFNDEIMNSQTVSNSKSNVEHEETDQFSSESSSSFEASDTETIQNDKIDLNGLSSQNKQDNSSTTTQDKCNCKKNKTINKKLNDRMEFLSDQILKFLFFNSMLSQSTEDEDVSNDETSKPLVLLDTNEPYFWKELLGDDTSSLVYFLQAQPKPTDK